MKNNNRGRKLASMLLIICMLLTFWPQTALAANETNGQGTVTVTVEYLEKDGSARYFLEPTAAGLKEGMTVVEAINAAYGEKGTVEETLLGLYGLKVTTAEGEVVQGSLTGQENWETFVNNKETGDSYNSLNDGDVIRLIYTRNYRYDITDYVSNAETNSGTLSVNKNSLITKLGRLTDEQKEANKDVYEQALRAALVNTGSQQDAADAEKLIDGILSPEIAAASCCG